MSVSAYAQAIEDARAAALGMTRTQAEAFRQLLEQYAEELATKVSAGVATRNERRAAALAREIIQQLTRDLATATRNGIVITSQRAGDIYARATQQLIDNAPGDLSIDVGQGIGSRAAQAVLARPSLAASFRSIQADSTAAVDRIIHRALLRGATSTEVAKEIRLHILGAEAFPPSVLIDRRRIGYDAIRQMGYEATRANLELVRHDAGVISNAAQLIARTEPMNAEWEVHRQSAIESSVVKAIRWRTSRRHPVQDACDALAEVDFFGLGPGTYDPRQLPRRPHPRCLCLQLDILLDPEEWGKERGPVPTLQVDLDTVATRYQLTSSSERSLRSVLGQEPRARPRPATRPAGELRKSPATPKAKPKPPPTEPGGPISKRKLRGLVKAREKEIAPLKIEWATAWNPETGERVVNKTSNAPNYVQFQPSEIPGFKDTVFTHNHPRSSSFSRQDVQFAIATDLQEIRATSVRYDHSLVRPAEGWPDVNKVIHLSYEVETRRLQQAVQRKVVIDDAWEYRNWHGMWREVFQRLGIPYTRVPHK